MESLVLFTTSGAPRIGILSEGLVLDMGLERAELPDAISAWGRGDLQAGTGSGIPLGEVSLLPPLALGARVFCVAQNYPAHAAEAGGASPASPIVFLKPHSAFVGDGASAVIPAISDSFDYEGEIAVVIGRAVFEEAPESTATAVAGYTIANDGSARNLQPATLADKPQVDWFAAKSIDHGSALGPGIVAAREVPPADELRLTTQHNGLLVQDDIASSMTHPIPKLISFISQIMRLEVGDIILTGTPAGVGKARGVYLAAGDTVTVSVSGVGTLTTHYV